MKEFPDALPADADARLLAHGIAAFGSALERPGLRAFWWPRFERIARWFIAEEQERRRHVALIRSELSGRLVLNAPAGAFTLTAKADRIDRDGAGGLVLVDYKTGAVPRAEDVALGFSPQLPLEAVIAEAGGFDGIAAAAVTGLEYWRLSGGDPPGEVTAPGNGDDPCALIVAALEGLKDLVAGFDDPATPYRARPRPERAPRYSDYVHLARVNEWSVMGENGE